MTAFARSWSPASGRAFSAGFDLDMEAGSTPDPTRRSAKRLHEDFRIIMRFWDCPKPTLAAAHGYCLGSAMELAMACDITIASEDCRFGAPEVKFGSGIVAMLAPWLAGPKHAKYLLLSGDDRVTAAQALDMGLVNRVVAAGRALDETLEIAQRIAANDAQRRETHQAGHQPQPRRRGLSRGAAPGARAERHHRDIRNRRIAGIQRHPETGRRQGRGRLAQRARQPARQREKDS